MGKKSRSPAWLVSLLLVSAITWACGDGDDGGPHHSGGSSGVGTNVGGDGLGGTGGDGLGGVGGVTLGGAGGVGLGGAGGDGLGGLAGGGAGEGSNPDCIEHDRCAVWGANFGCPTTVEEAVDFCSFSWIEVSRSESVCGGTIVFANNGIQYVEYSFDAEGELIGAISLGDVGDCDYFGTQCAPVGDPVLLCTWDVGGVGGAGGAGQ